MIESLKGAAEAGALAANYMEVTGLVVERGRVGGIEVADRLAGDSGTIRARQVINASGPWTDQVRFLEPGVRDRLLRPTKGIHIVVRKRDFPLDHAVFLRSPRDNRVVWPIPALDGDLVYIGTTDTEYDGSLDHVTATAEDVDYLLEVANFAIPDARLGLGHVVASWAGLRPLIKPEGDLAASAVSRDHQVMTSPAGLLTITGGKMTTARLMGEHVVDAAAKALAADFGLHGVPRSRSATVPLSGGAASARFAARRRASELSSVDPAIRQRWLATYGGNAPALVDRVVADPEAGRDLGSHHLSRAEVRYAVEEEMARTVADFFARRASIFFWTEDGGLSAADAVGIRDGHTPRLARRRACNADRGVSRPRRGEQAPTTARLNAPRPARAAGCATSRRSARLPGRVQDHPPQHPRRGRPPVRRRRAQAVPRMDVQRARPWRPGPPRRRTGAAPSSTASALGAPGSAPR